MTKLTGRHAQAKKDLRDVPREVESRLVAAFRDGTFQARWDEIVTEAEIASATGREALLKAAREMTIDFVELLREVLREREMGLFVQATREFAEEQKATTDQLQK